MNSSRATALGVVLLLHVGVFGALAVYRPDIIKKIVAPIEAVQVKEDKPPPEEPPPPPPKEQEIPPYVPPPEVSIASEAAPTITVQSNVPAPPPPVFTPPAPVAAPPAPPAPVGITRGAVPKGNQSKITTDDYPEPSIRAEEEGQTIVSYTVSADGRASNCSTTTSSGHPRLDARACELIVKRFRFDPAMAAGKPVESTKSQKITWQLPKN